MKPLALDLCCGKGGWTIGLLAAGWDVIGVDVEQWEGYPSERILADVRHLMVEDHGELPPLLRDINNCKPYVMSRKVSLVVASPPCQEFSITRQPFHKPHVEKLKKEGPDKSIWLACVRIAKELNVPLLLENVQGAEQWMGFASWHYGSYYFWGEKPALIPIPWYDEEKKKWSHRKGFTRINGNFKGKSYQGNGPDKKTGMGNCQSQFSNSRDIEIKEITKTKNSFCGESHRVQRVGKGCSRKEWSAKAAMIPYELAHWIGVCFKPRE